MIPTLIGLVQIVIGMVLLYRRSLTGMLAFVLLSGMMGGSAALSLPALGGSTVPPVDLAAGFLILRLLPRARPDGWLFRQAAVSLGPLILFVAYGAIMAYLGPRLFAHDMFVTPMRPDFESLHSGRRAYLTYYAVPLVPTAQNLTTPAYMVGGLLLSLGTYIVVSYNGGRETLVRCAVAIGFLHSLLGVFGLAVRGTPAEVVLDLFRNGNYAQVDQEVGGFARMNGIEPEPSAYAAYGLIWFAFLAECALRGVRPRATGTAAIALLIVLIAATSTTAYIGLAIYAISLLFRILFVPGSVRATGILAISGVAVTGFIAVTGLILLQPALAATLGDLLSSFTIGKSTSISAVQRGFWAKQGLDAFSISHGLGIGPGSFRSSSLATAILGSTGVIGAAAFAVLVLIAWKPLRPSTYRLRAPDPRAVGAAAGWAVLLLVLTATFAAPSPDPGPDFAVLVGAALALRRSRPAPAVSPPVPDLGEPLPSIADLTGPDFRNAGLIGGVGTGARPRTA